VRIEDYGQFFKKDYCHLFAFGLNPAERLGHHLQPGARFWPLPFTAGRSPAVKRHALAGPCHIEKTGGARSGSPAFTLHDLRKKLVATVGERLGLGTQCSGAS